jgi:small-conductance mechanosensitive channel
MLAVLVTLAVTLWLSGLIEQRLLRAPNLDVSLRTVLGKFLRALLLIIGVLFALQAVGIDLTLLSVFGGALGVGIGLGLQKLASNYIAGFTILLDRSIRLGDLISVDNRTGIVSKVTSRYVVVAQPDGTKLSCPMNAGHHHRAQLRVSRPGKCASAFPSRSPTTAMWRWR